MTKAITFIHKKKVAITVTNDLVADNRVHKVATTLTNLGFEVTLIGRKFNDSTPLKPRNYQTHRMDLLVNTGPLFYAFYNFSLFFHLAFKRYDLIVSNDLDSLPAGFLYSKMDRKTIVYDSHEYFTEVPELVNRPTTKKIWEWIEKSIVPNVRHCYTVCQSIADIYNHQYGTDFKVIRNVPFRKNELIEKKTINLEIPTDLPIILYQGAVNIGRGLEEMILAMKQIDFARLVIVGNGDLIQQCKNMVATDNLQSRVHFTGRIPYDEVRYITKLASVGISVEKDIGLNYRYALPNKLFDYIQSGIPILASSLPEIKRIVDTYQVGHCISETTPQNLVNGIRMMLENTQMLKTWQQNCEIAANELCWENEEKELILIYEKAVNSIS